MLRLRPSLQATIKAKRQRDHQEKCTPAPPSATTRRWPVKRRTKPSTLILRAVWVAPLEGKNTSGWALPQCSTDPPCTCSPQPWENHFHGLIDRSDLGCWVRLQLWRGEERWARRQRGGRGRRLEEKHEVTRRRRSKGGEKWARRQRRERRRRAEWS